MSEIKQVVVLGGGFGGINAAQTILGKTKNVEVTLIDPKENFVFTPLIHEVAAGHMTHELVETTYKQVFAGSKIKHINDYATNVNFENNTIAINNQLVPYDVLVLGTGAVSIKPVGHGTNTYELKTIEDAININESLKKLKAEVDNSNEKINIAIVGGGATGIEMALECRLFLKNYDRVKIYLVTRDADILLRFHRSIQICAKKRLEEFGIEILTNTEVSQIEGNFITLHDRTLETKMILWTVGVKPHYPFVKDEIETDERGRAVVDKFLRLTKYQNVYCVGDIVSGFQMDAQAAVWHGKYAGKNIARELRGEALEVKTYSPKGELISLGDKYAAGRAFGITKQGIAVWFLWRTAYLFKIPTLKRKFEVAVNWTLHLLTP